MIVPNVILIHAQENVRYPNRDRAAQYYLGTEDELLVPVNIWGFVQKPGQYLVPNNTDLVSLLSFAGGPSENAKISRIRLIRSDSKLGSHVYNIDLQKYLESGDDRINPTLKPGDTIIVKGTTFHWINKFFEFVSRLAIFAQIYYFIVISQDYLKK
jgi:hypothetical protein